jgi:hypothetical protein
MSKRNLTVLLEKTDDISLQPNEIALLNNSGKLQVATSEGVSEIAKKADIKEPIITGTNNINVSKKDDGSFEISFTGILSNEDELLNLKNNIQQQLNVILSSFCSKQDIQKQINNLPKYNIDAIQVQLDEQKTKINDINEVVFSENETIKTTLTNRRVVGKKDISLVTNDIDRVKITDNGDVVIGVDPKGNETLRIGGNSKTNGYSIIGNGNNDTFLFVNGSKNGVSTGSNISIQNGGNTIITFGNKSKIAGGNYDPTPFIWCSNGLQITLDGGKNVHITADNQGNISLKGSLTHNSDTLIETSKTLQDGKEDKIATLNNSPALGDPYKWVSINDNGETLWFPCWKKD